MRLTPKNTESESIAAINSEVIAKLLSALGKGEAKSQEAFRRKALDEKIPLIEEIENDSENIFCTFVFKGNEETKSVFVNLPPFSRISPDNFQMSKIKNTDIWFTRVKIPKESRFVYTFVINSPFQNVNPESPKSEIEAFHRASQADPLNQNRLGKFRSYIETPNAKPQKYFAKKDNLKQGNVKQFRFNSEILSNERSVSVYAPPDFDLHKTYPLLVLFDEEIYLDEINAPMILDNLLHENLIPPMIAVFIGNVENSRTEELVGSKNFCDFVNIELFSWIKDSYKISENLHDRILGGASFGGLCAVFTAVCCPHTFGKVLSQSGSFWKNSDAIFTKLSQQNSNKQRFYLDAGIYETEQKNGISLLDANRKLHDILLENEYAVDYQEFKGGHGAINWRETFAAGLIFLTEDLMESFRLCGNQNIF